MSAPQTPQPYTPAWQVTGQQQTTALGRAGQFQAGVRVLAALEDGTPFSVFVPQDEYRADRVRQLLQMVANEAASVQAIRGTAYPTVKP